jgi:hypothetical protein
VAVIRGIGPCAIPGENGLPCGRQVAEGEPVGTIAKGTAFSPLPLVGHRRCADQYYARIQQQEREKNLAMVQRINQSGPGGAIDPTTAFNPVQGSIPLDKQVKAEPKTQAPGTVIGDLSEGAHFIGDVPEDASPDEAVKYAKGEPIKAVGTWEVTDGLRNELRSMQNIPMGTAPAQAFYNAPVSDTLPQLDANDGKVIVTLMHLQSQLSLEDAEDLHQILGIQIGRARRQRG